MKTCGHQRTVRRGEAEVDSRFDGNLRDPRPRGADALARRWRELLDSLTIYREIRRTARAIRRDVGLSGVYSLDDVIAFVSARRGRPILVHFEPLPVTAACSSSADHDRIVVDSNASELLQLLAILHELGHLLYDAPRSACQRSDEAHEPMAQELARQLFPGLKSAEVTSFFRRSRYDSKQERRVEIFATVMLERHLLLKSSADFDSSTLTHRRAGV
ncbi:MULTISPECIES: ImmA/IrrE family metallo-endopeptidase [unclassified Streptomyces]|uniref:ImmA/IrrE family metallo-endopeptidase n=1 Tax=unclassified Streptomyces TaxID=2593676 RepID=UPI0033CB3F0B